VDCVPGSRSKRPSYLREEKKLNEKEEKSKVKSRSKYASPPPSFSFF
jgi:hypothetical protein